MLVKNPAGRKIVDEAQKRYDEEFSLVVPSQEHCKSSQLTVKVNDHQTTVRETPQKSTCEIETNEIGFVMIWLLMPYLIRHCTVNLDMAAGRKSVKRTSSC
jgi:hypothetical protein